MVKQTFVEENQAGQAKERYCDGFRDRKRENQYERTRCELKLCFHAAGAHEAPAAEGFVDGKDSEGGEKAAGPPGVSREEDRGDDQEKAKDESGDTTAAVDVWGEEVRHQESLP